MNLLDTALKNGENLHVEFKSSFQKEVIEPKFEEFVYGFRVTLYKEKLSGVVNEILILISNNPNLKAHQISDDLKIPLRTIQRFIKQFKDKNKIEFQGSPRTGGYILK